MSGWRVQRPARGYWLFGAWADQQTTPDGGSVRQVTLGFGPWKIQFVKVWP